MKKSAEGGLSGKGMLLCEGGIGAESGWHGGVVQRAVLWPERLPAKEGDPDTSTTSQLHHFPLQRRRPLLRFAAPLPALSSPVSAPVHSVDAALQSRYGADTATASSGPPQRPPFASSHCQSLSAVGVDEPLLLNGGGSGDPPGDDITTLYSCSSTQARRRPVG